MAYGGLVDPRQLRNKPVVKLEAYQQANKSRGYITPHPPFGTVLPGLQTQ